MAFWEETIERGRERGRDGFRIIALRRVRALEQKNNSVGHGPKFWGLMFGPVFFFKKKSINQALVTLQIAICSNFFLKQVGYEYGGIRVWV